MFGIWKTMAALAAAATLGVLASKAHAQQQPASAPKWLVSCSNTAADGGLRCAMSQSVIITQTGQRLLTVSIRKEPESDVSTMLLTLPVGFFLPEGVAMSIDDELAEQLPVQTCDGGGCYAGLGISQEVLDRLYSGGKLSFMIKDLQQNAINIDATLEGFSAAFERLI